MSLWRIFDVFKLEKVGQELRESYEQHLIGISSKIKNNE